MTTHKHLEEVDLGTLTPEEIKERLEWRDANSAEVLRHEQEQEARRQLDAEMEDVRDGYLLAGGTEEEFERHEKTFREELIADRAKAQADAARNDFARHIYRSF